MAANHGVEDMISLVKLTEEAILENIKLRYQQELIYTYTGSILVSANPYKNLPIYDTDTVQTYRGVRMGTLPPHIFATADTAYRNMREHRANQSVIISGESGAGKSESTKLILQYLAAMTANHSWVEQQILEANVVLESFGNAKTVRNNNSSRFGKFIEIHFNEEGHIVGAKIIQYLLEKSRIVYQANSERNYHIFYELCAGASDEEKATLKLLKPEQYHYLNQSGCVAIEGVNDSEAFGDLKIAMTVLGIANETQDCMFRVLSAVLLVGNIEFKSDGKDGCAVKNLEDMAKVAELLGVDTAKLTTALTVRTMKVRGQVTNIPLKPEQAADTRDALAKGLYGKMFVWLVDTINLSIDISKYNQFIGVLDIFGFENFKVNSFEQLCINYANEKLQQYFNQHIFKLEQEEYTREKVPWASIPFVDNQECLDLIEKKPMCLLSMLDEECKFPSGSDASLLGKLHQTLEKHKYYVKPRLSRTAFGVNHYAGEVMYETTSFLEKNRDTLYDELVELVQGSSLPFIASLFPQDQTSSAKKTVSTQFKEELNNLMKTLSETSPHYVRCIKPNTEKKPKIFDDKLVLDQLRFSGMLDTIKIRQAGFPVRFTFDTFYSRYKLLSAEAMRAPDVRTGCELVLREYGDLMRVGTTKVFMKEILEGKLADRRNQRLKEMAAKIQRRYRTFKAYQHYKKMRVSSVVFQKVIRGYFAQSAFEKQRAASQALAVALVGAIQRKRFNATRKAIAVCQLSVRKLVARKKASRIRNAIIKIQATYRMCRQRRAYKAKRSWVVLLESAIRGLLGRKHTKVELERRMKLLAEDESRMPPEEQARRQKLREEEAKKQAALEAKLRAEEDAKRKEEEAAKKAQDEIERKEREERQRIEREKRQKEMQELEALESDLKKQNAAAQETSGSDGLSVEDFESTLAELQSFIDGDVFTSLGGADAGPAAAAATPGKPAVKVEQEQQVALAPLPAPPSDDFSDDLDAAAVEAEAPKVERDSIENYDIDDDSSDDEDRPPPLNVYHNYTTFKLEAFAMNHFSAPPKKIKKDTWTKILSFSKKNISAPLLQQIGKDAALTNEALNIFDTIMKYQGEISQRKLLRKQSAIELVEYVVGKGIEVPELRDEIYCQLCKQTNNNPKPDAAIRGWELMSLVCSAFAPSKMLIKYVCNYIQSSIPREGDEGRFATFCLKRLTRTLAKGDRRLPPSEVELEAVKNRRSIITRVHMLDGQAKALDLDASTSTKEIFQSIADKISLTQTAGFALFEQFDQMERSLKPQEVLGDLLYKWEKNGRAGTAGASASAGQFKILLKRKLFLPPLPDPIDPVAKDLIFWQSMNEVVQGRLPCDEKDAVKLAAYHLQGVWGDCDPSKDYVKALSTDVSKYIPKGLISRHSTEEWKKRILPLHQELKGIDTQIARDMYVQNVKKWPLYGSVVFPVKGFGDLEKRLVSVAINWNGVHVLDRSTKATIHTYDHNQVLVASYTATKLNVTVELSDGTQKQYSFGTPMGIEVDPLVRVYNSFYRSHYKKTAKLDPAMEAAKLREAQEAERRLDAWATNTEDVEMPPPLDAEKFPFKEYAAQSFAPNLSLSFQRDPLQTSLHNDSSIAKDAAAVSTLITSFTWNISPVDKRKLNEAESVDVVKNILDQAIKKPKLRNEVFCQLIKQTTQNPHADVLLRAWQLLAVCCGTFLPTKDLMHFVRAHIQQGHQQTGERNLVMFAAYSNIRLQRTIGFGVRKDVPSTAEITSVIARRPYGLRVKTLDGKVKAIGIDPTTLAKDVVAKVARKLNLRDSKWFSLYEVVDDNVDEERCMGDSELIGDAMQRFEELEKKGLKNLQFVFKRKLFLHPEEEPSDPVLRDLLFYQALHDIIHDRYPLVSERDAVKQASFQMQILWGDHDPARDTVKQQLGTEAGLEKYIPRRLLPKMKLEQWQHEISTFYTALQGRSREECKDLYMKYVRKWPLYGDSVFNVKQNARTNIPKDLWLAVGKDSVKVLGVAEEVPLFTLSYDSIAHYGPSSATFFMVAGNLMNSQKYVFQTKQAADIASVLAVHMAEFTANAKQKAKRAG